MTPKYCLYNVKWIKFVAVEFLVLFFTVLSQSDYSKTQPFLAAVCGKFDFML